MAYDAELQFCPHCLAYKHMRRVPVRSGQVVSLLVAGAMIAWLLTQSTIHWTSWVLAAIVLPMTLYFGWPHRSHWRCDGCGRAMPASEV